MTRSLPEERVRSSSGVWRGLTERVVQGLDTLRLPGATVLPESGGGPSRRHGGAADLDALPVVDPDRPASPCDIVTRTGAQRVNRRVLGGAGGPTMAPTEES